MDLIKERKFFMNPMKRRTVIAGNWKMNFTPAEATAFINEVKPLVAGKDNCDVIFCAPYVTIAAAQEAAKGSNIKIGAENVHFAPKGAYTGEVSAQMLTACGVEYVIIGHSERRQYFGETDETVNLRTRAALDAGMKVILCLGEVKEERLNGITNEVVGMQTGLKHEECTICGFKRAAITTYPERPDNGNDPIVPDTQQPDNGEIEDSGEQPEEELSFFDKIIKAISDFFASIAAFFAGLFGGDKH